MWSDASESPPASESPCFFFPFFYGKYEKMLEAARQCFWFYQELVHLRSPPQGSLVPQSTRDECVQPETASGGIAVVYFVERVHRESDFCCFYPVLQSPLWDWRIWLHGLDCTRFYFEGSGDACAGRPAECRLLSRWDVSGPSVCVRSGAVQISGPASPWSRWASGGSPACCASETTVPSGSSADPPTVSTARFNTFDFLLVPTSSDWPSTDKRLRFTIYTAENEAPRLILKVWRNRREK